MLYFDVLNNPNKIKNFYTQVFCIKSKITRIFIYKINGKYKLTAEGIYEKDLDIKVIIKNINNILKHIDKKIRLSNLIGYDKIIKHNLYTKRDYNEFKKFELKNNNKIISGSWYSYSREKKISGIIEHLKKLKL